MTTSTLRALMYQACPSVLTRRGSAAMPISQMRKPRHQKLRHLDPNQPNHSKDTTLLSPVMRGEDVGSTGVSAIYKGSTKSWEGKEGVSPPWRVENAVDIIKGGDERNWYLVPTGGKGGAAGSNLTCSPPSQWTSPINSLNCLHKFKMNLPSQYKAS